MALRVGYQLRDWVGPSVGGFALCVFSPVAAANCGTSDKVAGGSVLKLGVDVFQHKHHGGLSVSSLSADLVTALGFGVSVSYDFFKKNSK